MKAWYLVFNDISRLTRFHLGELFCALLQHKLIFNPEIKFAPSEKKNQEATPVYLYWGVQLSLSLSVDNDLFRTSVFL